MPQEHEHILPLISTKKLSGGASSCGASGAHSEQFQRTIQESCNDEDCNDKGDKGQRRGRRWMRKRCSTTIEQKELLNRKGALGCHYEHEV